MKALYARAELRDNPFQNAQIVVPLQRYLHRFINERSKIAHLKHHEKDFLFEAMMCLYDSGGGKVYDLFKIPEAREFLFYWIILIHSNIIMVFDGKIPVENGRFLTTKEKRRNKRFFYEYLQTWKNQIEAGKGPYLSIVKPAIHQKLKDWREYASETSMSSEALKQKEIYIYACFYDIYYNVKLYFDALPKPYLVRKINGYDVVFNIYSYVHIYSRHYIPNMNLEIGLSTNPELPEVDVEEMPVSILNLIERYTEKYPITPQTEYCLFKKNGEKFILWLKYKTLNETKNDGFEVRSFYKCLQESDLIKFETDVRQMCF